jgi:hypothetical protein
MPLIEKMRGGDAGAERSVPIRRTTTSYGVHQSAHQQKVVGYINSALKNRAPRSSSTVATLSSQIAKSMASLSAAR